MLSLLFMLFPLSIFLSACNDDTSTIGSSLVTDQSEIVVDSTFTITGHSVVSDDMRARTLSQLLGSIDATSYGSLTSDFVTQLMPSASFDTVGASPETVDSIILQLRFYSNRITGDSMMPMGMTVYALNRQLPSQLTSSFDPQGYYDPNSPLASSAYSSNTLYSDSLEKVGVHVIQAHLPIEIGRDMLAQYFKNPAVFESPDEFAKLFPGLYITNSFGSGRVTNIFNTRLLLYYRSNTTYTTTSGEERDTTYYNGTVIAASTPEVLANNNLRFDISPTLTALAAREPIVVAPLGYECRINVPISQVVTSFTNGTKASMGVVNSLTLTVPVEEITNSYGINPPSHLLLVPTRDRDKFFDNQEIPDNVTTYIAEYDSVDKAYQFSGLRALMMHVMGQEMSSAEIAELSEFSLIPVEVTTESYTTSSYQVVEVITAVGPYVESPSMVHLKIDDAKLKLTYSTEKVIF